MNLNWWAQEPNKFAELLKRAPQIAIGQPIKTTKFIINLIDSDATIQSHLHHNMPPIVQKPTCKLITQISENTE